MGRKEKKRRERPLTAYFTPFTNHNDSDDRKEEPSTKRQNSAEDESSNILEDRKKGSEEDSSVIVRRETHEDVEVAAANDGKNAPRGDEEDVAKGSQSISEKKQKEPRQLLSSTIKQSASSSNNVVHRLMRQSIDVSHRSRMRDAPSELSWKLPSWIDFEGPSRHVISIAFDSVGVLLAVAYEDGFIRIFDWDTVHALDRKGRIRKGRFRRSQQKTGGCFLVEPVLEFQLPRRSISFLKWNKFHPDELAVGIRYVPVY